MKGADGEPRAQGRKCDWLAFVLINQATDFLRHLNLRIAGARVARMAAKAGAKTRLLRLLR